MKRFAVGLLAGFALFQVSGAQVDWLTDLSKAQTQAKAENKLVWIDFTGSDWCGYSIKLNKQVFSTQEFADYAKKNLVMVEADFPHNKKLPATQQKANEALKEKYHVEGFPTLVILDGEGKKLGEQVGYDGDSPKQFI